MLCTGKSVRARIHPRLPHEVPPVGGLPGAGREPKLAFALGGSGRLRRASVRTCVGRYAKCLRITAPVTAPRE